MTDDIKAVVAEWYGLPPSQMPMRILTRDEERDGFEADHPEIPAWCWEAVNHAARQTFLWVRHPGLDLVIWDHARGGYCLIQDLVFKDNYPDEKAWWAAVQTEVTERSQVWFCFHE